MRVHLIRKLSAMPRIEKVYDQNTWRITSWDMWKALEEPVDDVRIPVWRERRRSNWKCRKSPGRCGFHKTKKMEDQAPRIAEAAKVLRSARIPGRSLTRFYIEGECEMVQCTLFSVRQCKSTCIYVR